MYTEMYTDGQTDRPTDRVRYRAAEAANQLNFLKTPMKGMETRLNESKTTGGIFIKLAGNMCHLSGFQLKAFILRFSKIHILTLCHTKGTQ